MDEPKKKRRPKANQLPPSKVKKNRGIPFSAEQWAEIEAGAEAACLPKAVFLRRAGLQAARRAVKTGSLDLKTGSLDLPDVD